jgi:hypothetical protein
MNPEAAPAALESSASGIRPELIERIVASLILVWAKASWILIALQRGSTARGRKVPADMCIASFSSLS